MNIKEFLKPDILKIFIFLFIGIFYLYFARESVSAVGISFAFFYTAYGFPFLYAITGNIDYAPDYAKTLFFGEFFKKSGNFLFNPVAFAVNVVLIYALSCFISILVKNIKFKH